MGFGTNIMKSLMFIFNGIVWVLGLVLFVVGIVVLVEGENWNEIIDGKTVPVSVLLIVVGFTIAVIGFLGCFGAMKQNSVMLLIYTVVLGVVILVQLVAGILAFIFSDEAQTLVEEGLDTGLKDYGDNSDTALAGEDSVWTMGIDWVQEHMECCGIRGAEDWKRTYDKDGNLNGKAVWWISPNGGKHVNDVPDSCCKIADGQDTYSAGCGSGKADGVSSTINNNGCLSSAVDWIQEYAMVMGICGICFISIEFFCIIFAFCLRKRSSYKS